MSLAEAAEHGPYRLAERLYKDPPVTAAELLDGEIFYSLREAQVVIESWRRHYNQVRPHASLGYRAPAPEVVVPVLAARIPAPPRPASATTPIMAPRPVMH